MGRNRTSGTISHKSRYVECGERVYRDLVSINMMHLLLGIVTVSMKAMPGIPKFILGAESTYSLVWVFDVGTWI